MHINPIIHNPFSSKYLEHLKIVTSNDFNLYIPYSLKTLHLNHIHYKPYIIKLL
jgi:hypothetical protein